MRRAILASALALTGLLTAANTASAQVYYNYGYPTYSYPGYYPSYGGVVTSSYYYPSTGVVSPYSTFGLPSGVVTSSYYTPGYTTGYYPSPYAYSSGYMPYSSGYYGGYRGGYYGGGRRWR
jgi:hypothetical protein